MGVISRPPSPAAAADSIAAVSEAWSAMLPNHHQRDQGLVSRETAGQSRAAAGGTSESAARRRRTRARGMRGAGIQQERRHAGRRGNVRQLGLSRIGPRGVVQAGDKSARPVARVAPFTPRKSPLYLLS